MELGAHVLLHQLLRELELFRLEGRLLGQWDLGEGPHLLGVTELLHHQAILGRPQHHQVLLAARGVLGETGHAGAPHGGGQQCIGALCSLVGPQVVGPVVVNGVHLGDRHELGERDRSARGLLQRLELLGREEHVLVLRVLVALCDIVPLDGLVVLGAHVLLLERRAALFVHHTERDGLRRLPGRVEPDRDRDQAERDGGRTDGMSSHE